MSSVRKDNPYPAMPSSRRSSSADAQAAHGFFAAGQGGRPVLPPLSDSLPNTSRFPVPPNYSTAYTQPRSAANINPQLFNTQYSGSSPQFSTPSTFTNYEIADRYSPQPYPTYSTSRTPPPPPQSVYHAQPEARRLRTPPPPADRWMQQTQYVQPTPNYAVDTHARAPAAPYPGQYLPYPQNNPGAYSYMQQDQMTLSNVFEDMPRMDHPRSSSPYRGAPAPMHVQTRASTPPPISPTSPEETTIKKKRKRADAAQLKVLNETYARTAFPSTDERVALAKMLDMSARSVQIWFQNKRQSMRQTNRQSSTTTGSSHPYHPGHGDQGMVESLVPRGGYDTTSSSLYMAGQDPRTMSHSSMTHYHTR